MATPTLAEKFEKIKSPKLQNQHHVSPAHLRAKQLSFLIADRIDCCGALRSRRHSPRPEGRLFADGLLRSTPCASEPVAELPRNR